jgi:hypothetical protein
MRSVHGRRLGGPAHTSWPSPGDERPYQTSKGRRQDVKLELLARFPLFSRCSRRDLVRLGRISELSAAHPGESLLVQGAPCDWWIGVAVGSALVLRDDRPVGLVGPGDWCGEGPLVCGLPCDISVVALTPMTVVVMSRKHFLALPSRFPEVATHLVRALCARSFCVGVAEGAKVMGSR